MFWFKSNSIIQSTIKLMSFVLVFLFVLVCAGIPSIFLDSLMNGTQSGKSFVFMWGTGLISVFGIIKFWLSPLKKEFHVSIIDLLFSTFLIYVATQNNFRELTHSLLFLEFIYLSAFYFILRRQNKQVYLMILMAILVGGLIQSIYGNLQLWGYIPSHHGLFKMTGSFFNPGPYAGYLAVVFPISLGFYLFNISLTVPVQNQIFLKWASFIRKIKIPFSKTPIITHFFYDNKGEFTSESQVEDRMQVKCFTLKFFILISLTGMCLVLPASRSRAAWLAVLVSSFYLFSVKYQFFSQLKLHFNTLTKRLVAIGVLLVLLTISGVGLYSMDKGSADGRLLIWKVGIEMIKEEPIFGHGYDGFKKNYMDYQATYFKDNPNSEEALVAGDSNYAFNESMQLIVENGLIGITPLILIVLLIFFKKYETSNIDIGQNEKIEEIAFVSRPSHNPIEQAAIDLLLLHISRAVILSFLVFSLFSYPLQILPVKICLVTALTISTSVLNRNKLVNYTRLTNHPQFFRFAFKSLISIGCLGALWFSIVRIKQMQMAYTSWKNAFDLYSYGLYDDCLVEYNKANLVLDTNGDFLTNYGKAVSMADKHTLAIGVLQIAAKYYPNIVVYTALGDSFKKLGRFNDAEHAYLHAGYMNPSRFYPKYLLAKLYDESGQRERAIEVAKELLSKDIKIESKAIQEILDEMKRIIEKNNSEIRDEGKI